MVCLACESMLTTLSTDVFKVLSALLSLSPSTTTISESGFKDRQHLHSSGVASCHGRCEFLGAGRSGKFASVLRSPYPRLPLSIEAAHAADSPSEFRTLAEALELGPS